MFIRAYLRASTKEQDSNRSRDELISFVDSYDHKIASFYIENISGTEVNRPELLRLLNDAQEDDILLIENIDRLTRLNEDDWKQLKIKIDAQGLNIVAIDIPTSHLALNNPKCNEDGITKAVMNAVNNMLIDIMAAISRKDYLLRKKRQTQGISKAKQLGKYKGRKPDNARIEKVLSYLFNKEQHYTMDEISKLTNYSKTHLYRIKNEHLDKSS